MEHTYPMLKNFCRQLGLEFQVSLSHRIKRHFVAHKRLGPTSLREPVVIVLLACWATKGLSCSRVCRLWTCGGAFEKSRRMITGRVSCASRKSKSVSESPWGRLLWYTDFFADRRWFCVHSVLETKDLVFHTSSLCAGHIWAQVRVPAFPAVHRGTGIRTVP